MKQQEALDKMGVDIIRDMVASGASNWGKILPRVTVKESGNLLLFNYKAALQYTPAQEWTETERVSRGLVIEKDTGRVIAWPFSKFWGWGEHGLYSDADIISVQQKHDGSLGIAFYYAGEWRVCTRGSFDSDQAKWATKHLRNAEWLKLLDRHSTHLFEIVYPENQIVVDYKGYAGLIYLNSRDNRSGRYCMPSTHSGFEKSSELLYCDTFAFARTYRWDDVENIKNAVHKYGEERANAEGFVVRFADGQFFKFKSAWYMRLHRILHGLNFNRILAAHRDDTLDDILSLDLPDDARKQVEEYIDIIDEKIEEICKAVSLAHMEAPDRKRKHYAKWVFENYKQYAPYLFALYDGRDIKPMIYQNEFK